MTENPKFPVNEVFTSIQGEGKFTGVPSIFVRVSGCNLRCVFSNGRSMCDTPYSSFRPEKSKFTIDEIVSYITSRPQVSHIVITGGEPFLYLNGMKKFIETLFKESAKVYTITIETNGTFGGFDLDFICDNFLPYSEGDELKHNTLFYSISPKLNSSVDHNHKFLTPEQVKDHDLKRINIDSLATLIINSSFQLKFVYSGKECVDEIKDTINKVVDNIHKRTVLEKEDIYEIVNNAVMLMPEGETEEQVRETAKEAVDIIIENGWKFSHRVHILIWGNKRAV